MAASTDFFTSDGSKIYISAGVPATQDSAGYSALTFTEIKEVTDLGTMGAVRALVTHTPVADGVVRKRKGSTNYGTMALKMARVVADPGQAIVKAAAVSNEEYAFKVLIQDGTVFYFQGVVMGYPISIGAADKTVDSDVAVELNTAIVEVAA